MFIRHLRTLLQFFAASLLLLSWSFSSAATISVPVDQPSVIAAVAAAADGDTITVAAGMYAGDVTVNKQVTITGFGGTVVGKIQIDSPNVTISNLTVQNPDGNFGILVNGVGSVSITNNTVSNVATGTPPAFNSYGIYFQDGPSNANGITITGNTVDAIGKATAVKSNGGIGIGDSTGTALITGVTISNNTISNITTGTKGAYAIILNHATSGVGSTEATVTNNTISNLSGTWVHAIALEGNTPNTTVTGNTISSLNATTADEFPITIEANSASSGTSPTASTFFLGSNTNDGNPIVTVPNLSSPTASCVFSSSATTGPVTFAPTLSWACTNVSTISIDNGVGTQTNATGSAPLSIATPQVITYTLLATAVAGANPIVPPITLTATGAQVITFNALSPVTYGDAPVTLSATSTSPTTITFSTTTPTVCAVSGTTVTILAVGTCSIDADQIANPPLYPAPAAKVTQTLTINPKQLTVSGGSVTPKVYDNTTDALLVLAGTGLVGVVPGDEADVVLDTTGATGSFGNEHVGTSKSVTVTGMTITGAKSPNYTITQPTYSADITARPITVTAAVNSKVYDGNTSATAVPTITNGTLAVGDTAAFAESYADEMVGAGNKVVIPSGAVTDGNSGNNYAVTFANDSASTISPRTLTVTATGTSKTYDGTTAAPIPGAVTLSDDRVPGDTLTLTATATFADELVGAAKPVSVTGIAISGGTDAGNYTLGNTTAATTASIVSRLLTVVPTVATRVYDTTTGAVVTFTDNRIAGDVFGVAGIGAYSDENAGVGKTFYLQPVGIAGPDASNYTVVQPADPTGTITPAPLTASFTANNKVYDGITAAAIATSSISGTLPGDTVTVSGGTATFANKNVGTGKTVTASGFTLGGADAPNYTITTVNPTTADITSRPLVVTATGINKVYDATTTATVSFSDDRVAGDVITANGTATFADKNVGVGKLVSVTGISLSGTDATNYTANTAATTTASITARPITVTATTNTKVYDTNMTATAVPTLTSGTLAGTDTATYSEAYTTKNVGTGKTLVPVATVSDDNSGNNYTVTYINDTTGVITAAPVTISFTANDKTYDSNTTATIATRTVVGSLGTDVVTASGGTATFDTKHAGVGKTVTASGFTLDGADATNYTINSTQTATAAITPFGITLQFTANNKPFDGTTVATIASRTLTGVLSGDTVTVDGGTATFADSAVGTDKTVTAPAGSFTLGGTDGGNYTITSVAETKASIAQSGGGGPLVNSGSGPSTSGVASGGSGAGSTPNPTQTFTPDSSTQTPPLTFGAQTGTVAGESTFKFNKNMSLRSRISPDVVELQKVLIKKGLLRIAQPSGYYGVATFSAVQAYQRSHGIPQTGNVGPATRNALNAGK